MDGEMDQFFAAFSNAAIAIIANGHFDLNTGFKGSCICLQGRNVYYTCRVEIFFDYLKDGFKRGRADCFLHYIVKI